jgi:hypothetical protein
MKRLTSFSKNPFLTQDDMHQALLGLFSPLIPFFSNGSARVSLGVGGATFLEEPAELEGFARPLWGLIPLAVGSHEFPNWDLFQEGIRNGTNPDHREFWGYCHDRDQRLVELAVFGYALAAIPEILWDPLDERTKVNLASWMSHINQVEMYDNNFWFFRVLVNVGLDLVGAGGNKETLESDLAHIEDLYQGEGWYSDGHGPQFDYYNPWAMHYYGLIYATLAGEADPGRATQYRERAELFAQDFIHWFNSEGAALPFGRSLTYRFCQAAFWGVLANAGIEALPWGVIKGLVLRHLRWWARQPIFSEGGLLSIGYAYPCLNMAEGYNSPMSPYWAFKVFIPLALSENHPFWAAEELPLPELPAVSVQEKPGMIFCRDSEHDHLFALSQRQYARAEVIPEFRHAIEKYCKFAYSTSFGFSVPAGRIGLRQGAYDSTLALSEDGEHYWVRERSIDFCLEGEISYSRWRAAKDVDVETWLIPWVPWHIRIHRIRTDRQLLSAEGGFAIARDGTPTKQEIIENRALIVYPDSWSGLIDLPIESKATRHGEIVRAEPNTNLLYPRTLIPTLIGLQEPGEYWLACAVIAVPGSTSPDRYWRFPPLVQLDHANRAVYCKDHSGKSISTIKFAHVKLH